jgi:hypothetical protein
LHSGGLRDTARRLAAENHLASGVDGLASADLPEIQTLLAARELQMENVDLPGLIAYQVAATNMSNGNAALSGLLFAGNLLWSDASQDLYISFGASILSDLRQMLPGDREPMVAAIVETYSEIVQERDIRERLPAGKLFDLGRSLEQGFEAFHREPWRVAFPALNAT